jgi:diguanylate cyclase (GGDEF)-like protein
VGLDLPSVFHSWLGLGMASLEGGRYVEGLELCRRAVVAGPAEADNHVNLVRALMLLGRGEEAREAALEGVVALPGDPVLSSLMRNIEPAPVARQWWQRLLAAPAPEAGASSPEARRLSMELWTERQEQHHLRTRDPMTGLLSRGPFLRAAQPAVDYAVRRGRGTALLYIDLDDFRALNETVGMSAGDQMLRAAARCLRDAAGDDHVVARVGGDGFAVLLTNMADEASIARKADQLRECLAECRPAGCSERAARASVGIAVCPRDARDSATLLVRAESALRRAKELGGGRSRFFSQPVASDATPGLSLECRLKGAMERNELTVYFQPIRHAATSKLVGAETLVRWIDPERGSIPPSRFIPVAEETGLILPLGEWILRSALSHWLGWQRRGLVDFELSVNFSSRQLRYPKQVQCIAETLHEVGVAPGSLRVEITESSLLQDTAATVASLEVLNRMGIELSLDDFGTGYSSLKMLRRIPFSHVKIGDCFIHEIGSGRDGSALPGAIIALAHELGKEVVAEGVENETQLAFLQKRGCDLLQGRLLGREMPAEDFEAMLLDEQAMARLKVEDGRTIELETRLGDLVPGLAPSPA